MHLHTVRGGGGLRLAVREWGQRDGAPVLLVHGWSQNQQCWQLQYDSPLLAHLRMVAFDLRGHGGSEAPTEGAAYGDGAAWAEDVAAIMRELGLERPVLVGWSYGGFVIGDYLRGHTDQALGGIVFVAGAVVLGPAAFGPLIGPGFFENAPGACDADPAIREAAMRRFLAACIVGSITPEMRDAVWAFNMQVAPHVRALLIQRELDYTEELDRLHVPVLVVHGRADTVVQPAMSEYILRHCRGAQASWYEGVGHAPFLESPDRFNRELVQFVGGTQRTAQPH
jgi:non-heme chloroperoxidase